MAPSTFRALLVPLSLSVASCESVSYFSQAAAGQLEITHKRRPLADVLGDPSTPTGLRKKIVTVEEVLAFANNQVGLQSNGSYSLYADLDRPYVVWNIFACPKFSLEKKTWRYPLVGKLSYRGYFREAAATRHADRISKEGYDVFVAGIEAYSTLGWFKDPLLNTFMDRSDPELASLIFHELAHQRMYLKDDTDFNEAFAVAVEEEATKLWLRSRGDYTLLAKLERWLERSDRTLALINRSKLELQDIYTHKPPLPLSDLKREKQRVFRELKDRYHRVSRPWKKGKPFNKWFSFDLNNAHLSPIGTYHDLVPAFRKLFQMSEGNFEEFFRRVEDLGKLPPAQRHNSLRKTTSS